MSKQVNQALKAWLDVAHSVRRNETTWLGHPLSGVDHGTYTACAVMNAMVIHDLSNQYEGLSADMPTLTRWTHNFVRTDVLQLSTIITACVDLLLDRVDPSTRTGARSVGGFKRRLVGICPSSGWILAPLSGLLEAFLETGDPHLFAPLYQILKFSTHLSLVDIDNAESLEAEWIKNENHLLTLDIPDWLMFEMNAVMREWLRLFYYGRISFARSLDLEQSQKALERWMTLRRPDFYGQI